MMVSYTLLADAENSICNNALKGYRIVNGSVYPFMDGKSKACFFAFYTKNPDDKPDVQGNGNTGDAIWYGYYKIKFPSVIYQLPKPDNIMWSGVCSIEAISFKGMYNNRQRNITIIGSCDKNAKNYTFPFIFSRRGSGYSIDKNIFFNLYGILGLTIEDLQKYIKNPDSYFYVLQNREKKI